MSVISKLRPKFVVDANGRRTAVMLDIEDAKDLERAIAEADKTIPWEQAERLLEPG